MKDRRELLKGLAVGSAWATPVVSSVVLPVHAETSGSSGCAGCYSYEGGSYLVGSDVVPGVYDLPHFENTICEGETAGGTDVIFATTEAEAVSIATGQSSSCGNVVNKHTKADEPQSSCGVWEYRCE
jgi:hypothetical protein